MKGVSVKFIALGLLALTLTACGGAAVATPSPTPGIFIPTVTLDPSQVEVVPPTEYVKVTPQECIDALDADKIAFDLALAVESTDVAVIKAWAKYALNPSKTNLSHIDTAQAARDKAFAEYGELDWDKINALREACYDSAEVGS